MSKATYHVPQPGEMIHFIDNNGFEIHEIVKSWDSKHGVLTTDYGRRVHIKDRSSIKLVEPAKEEARQDDGPHFAYAPAKDDAIAPTKHTATLPTSFASEVERAQAIADAEAEEKTRSETAINEMNRLADEIVALTNKRRDVVAANEDAEEDHQHRVDYLRSLRVRGE
jgi:predicted  nucleic acid-binding Zn-ribbon protein